MGLAASTRRDRVAEAAAELQRHPTATAGWERVQGLRCCEVTAAAAALRHPRIVTAEIPVRAADACGRPRDWSALPDLPLSVVARRLHTLKDFLSFRGVCTSWRSVGTAMKGDVMASQPPLFFGCTLRSFYHPGEKRVYGTWSFPGRLWKNIVGISHGYVILKFLDKPRILNPLTGEENLCFPRSEIPILQAHLSSPPTSPDCVLLVCGRRSTIQYCRPGDKGWCEVRWGDLLPREVVGLAIVRGKGYALLDGLGVASFDFTGRPAVLTVLSTTTDTRALASHFLAESNGELFALPPVRLFGEYVNPAVYRFDTLTNEWVKSDDVGGRAVLVEPQKMALFVDNFDKWGGSKGCIYACNPSTGTLWKYKLKDATSDPSLFPFAHLPRRESWGFWVLPGLLLSSSLREDGRATSTLKRPRDRPAIA